MTLTAPIRPDDVDTVDPTDPLLVMRHEVELLHDSFHLVLVPAVDRLFDAELTMTAFTAEWERYYFGSVIPYEAHLRHIWQSLHGGSRGVTPGLPEAPAGSAALLAFYPVNVSHHNLHRLVEVLEDALGERTAAETETPQRFYDLAVVIDSLDALLRGLHA